MDPAWKKGYGQIIPKDVTHEANGRNTTLGSRNAKSSSRRRRALLQHTHNIITYYYNIHVSVCLSVPRVWAELMAGTTTTIQMTFFGSDGKTDIKLVHFYSVVVNVSRRPWYLRKFRIRIIAIVNTYFIYHNLKP